jgi:hypothetical protein
MSGGAFREGRVVRELRVEGIAAWTCSVGPRLFRALRERTADVQNRSALDLLNPVILSEAKDPSISQESGDRINWGVLRPKCRLRMTVPKKRLFC